MKMLKAIMIRGPHGISIENASYIENNLEIENSLDSVKVNEDYTPKLFSEDDNHKIEEEDPQNEKLFGQHLSDDEEFEIPAFLKAKVLRQILNNHNEITPHIIGSKTSSSDDR